MNFRHFSLIALIVLGLATNSIAATPSAEDQEVLSRGPVDEATYIAGGIVGTFVGFGLGNAIEGTYLPRGLIFTVGEAGMLTLFTVGVVNCTVNTTYSFDSSGITGGCSNGASAEVIIGGLGFLGLHIWEIVDVWFTPPDINERFREVRDRVYRSKKTTSTWGILPATSPNQSGIDGATMAFQIHF